MKRVSQAQMEAYQTKINARMDAMHQKLQVLIALEKKIAEALGSVLPVIQTQVAGYDIMPIKVGRRTKWVWKHFIRNSRALKPFDTREECVKSAKRDALEQLAHGRPSRDISTILASVERESEFDTCSPLEQIDIAVRGGRLSQQQPRVHSMVAR